MRYTKSIYKKSRRLGFSLLENNKEFTTGKQRTTRPGQHGAKRIKLSNYAQQLQEKQKMMYLYGLNDRQFRRLFAIAAKTKGATTLNLVQVMESRLDSLVFRAGFAPTRRGARQLVTHGHILLNGKKASIPSMLVSIDDVISIAPKSKDLPLVNASKVDVAPFLTLSKDRKATYTRLPEREEVIVEINEAYIVE